MEKKDILYTIYSAKTGIDIFDLLYECSIGYGEVKSLLDEWIAEDLLKTEDGRSYKFIGDGRMFSGKRREVDPLEERRTYLEARRQEIVRRMQEETRADGEDEDEAEVDALDVDEYLKMLQNGGESDDVDKDSPDANDPLRRCIFDSIKESVTVTRHDEIYSIRIEGLDLCGTDADFELFPHEDKVYLGDRGAMFSSLEESMEMNEELREKMAQTAADSGAEIMDEKLCVEIPSVEQTLACLFKLYAAMERLSHMGDGSSQAQETDAQRKYIKVLEYIVRSQKASITDLHMKFGIAPHELLFMLKRMEGEGFITPFDDESYERKVLLTYEEFLRRFGKK